MKGRVLVRLRKEVLDPQGATVAQALENLGYEKVISVRQGKFFEIELDVEERPIAARMLSEMSEKLLVNPVIEDYQIMLVAEPAGDAFDRRAGARRSDERRSGRDRREDARRALEEAARAREEAAQAREEAAQARGEDPDQERRAGNDRRVSDDRRDESERREDRERREGDDRRAGIDRRQGIDPEYLGSERRRGLRRLQRRRAEDSGDSERGGSEEE